MNEERIAVGDGRDHVELVFGRKTARLGGLAIDQWWLPIGSLYGGRAGPRARAAGNSEAVAAAFWGICREYGTHAEPDVGESYLLSRLVPHMRSGGGRRVFADGFLGRRAARPAGDGLPLDELVQAEARRPCPRKEFHRRTKAALARPKLPAKAREEYRRLCADLFPHALERLPWDEASAVRAVTAAWEHWTTSVGRRAGQPARKLAMDMLSYEARAAFHRAYSAVWCYRILPALRTEHGMAPEAADFHEFWHTDPAWEGPPGAAANFHLFHGHVFGLHPAGAAFLQTLTGRGLVGAWLAVRRRAGASPGPDGRLWSGLPDRPAAGRPSQEDEYTLFGRVLSGYLTSVSLYSVLRVEIADGRRPSDPLPRPDRHRNRVPNLRPLDDQDDIPRDD